MSLSRLRLLLWVMVGAVGIGLVALVWRQSDPQRSAATSLGTIGGPFTLIGTDGKPFASSKLIGKPSAIFFGFTHCPDVCPTTLARLTKLRKQLGKGQDAFSIVLISVDPERDTPADLREYVTLFDTPVIALTGSAAQVEQVKKQFGAFSRKVEQPGGGYNVEHTAAVMLMDEKGDFVATLTPEEGDQMALDKLERITA